MNFDKIKRMSDEKKRAFSISAAFLLTILIGSIWFIFNSIYGDDEISSIYKESPIEDITKSFKDIFQNTPENMRESSEKIYTDGEIGGISTSTYFGTSTNN
jgi:hypothetical protein